MSVWRPMYRSKDGTKKHSRIWWAEFCVNGRRFRESTGQRTKALALRYEDRRRNELDGRLMIVGLSGMQFADRYWHVLDKEPMEMSGLPERGTWTYIVYHPSSGHIKVGKTAQPRSRLASLQVASSCDLILLDLLDGDRELELHAELQGFKVRGEWFAPEIHELVRAVEAVETAQQGEARLADANRRKQPKRGTEPGNYPATLVKLTRSSR